MFGFLDPVLLVAQSLLTGLADALAIALGENATAGAILLTTLAVRVLLLPLTVRSLRARAAQASIAPTERMLRQQFARDPGRLRREIADLRARNGVSQWAAIVPMLAQSPVILLLYRLFSAPTIGGHANLLYTHALFGLPLGSRFAAAVASGYLPIYLGLFLVIGLAAWWSSSSAKRSVPQDVPDPRVAAISSTIARVLPFGALVVTAFVPLAVGIYLAVTSWWTATERHFGARMQAG